MKEESEWGPEETRNKNRIKERREQGRKTGRKKMGKW